MSSRIILLVGLVIAELMAVVLVFQVLTDFQCNATETVEACRFVRSLLGRAIVLTAAISLFTLISRKASAFEGQGSSHPLATALGSDPALRAVGLRSTMIGPGPSHVWLVVHLAGFLMVLSPVFLVRAATPDAFLANSLAPWLLGSSFAALGAAAWIASPQEWGRWIVDNRRVLLPVVVFSAFVPDLANLALPLWDLQILTSATFSVVAAMLALVGDSVHVDPSNWIIGLEGFVVAVGQPCSGIEGLVLTGGFIGLYGFLFRKDLHMLRYWTIVLPFGLAASWAFNSIRIFSLVLIGARISPELAVGGFHSYAGWMFFSLLAFLLVWLIHVVGFIHVRTDAAPIQQLGSDPYVSCILPITVFFVTGVIASSLTTDVDVAFPARALALGAVLGIFWRQYRELIRSVDMTAVLAGAAVGLLWLATEPQAPDGEALRTMLLGLGPVAMILWLVLRVSGSVLFVPLAEELFFRGYLLGRLDTGSRRMRLLAILFSSALFGLLHDRWLAGFAAGIAFALVTLRRNRLADAIIAHMIANGVIAAAVLARGDWFTL